MDAYTSHLLALAYEACGGTLDLDRRPRDGWYYADGVFDRHGPDAYPTLAEALAALLTGLGVPVPERPSAEELLDLEHDFRAYGGTDASRDYLRREQSSEPLLVSAWLEGDPT